MNTQHDLRVTGLGLAPTIFAAPRDLVFSEALACARMKQKPCGFREAKRTRTPPCAEGTLHKVKPCFIFHAQNVRFIEKSTLMRAFFWVKIAIMTKQM